MITELKLQLSKACEIMLSCESERSEKRKNGEDEGWEAPTCHQIRLTLLCASFGLL